MACCRGSGRVAKVGGAEVETSGVVVVVVVVGILGCFEVLACWRAV